MFSINEWRERYEVSLKGREPKGDEELRAGPLLYVRLKVYGHRQGTGYRRLQQSCGTRFMEVFGTFCKFLEISGNQPRERRGDLLNEKDEAATIADLAFILGISEEQAGFAVDKLCEVGWILGCEPTSKQNTTKQNTTKQNTTKHKAPELSGKIRNPPDSKHKFLDYVHLSDQEHKKLIERFGAAPTKLWIEKLDSYIGSKGKKYKSHYKTIISWSLRDGNGRTGIPIAEQKTQTKTTKNERKQISDQDFGELLDPLK